MPAGEPTGVGAAGSINTSTLFTRIMALVLATNLLTQLLGLALHGLLPAPAPSAIPLAEVAIAIRADNGLLSSYDLPGPVEPDPGEARAAAPLAQQLAADLGLAAEDVRIGLDAAQRGQPLLQPGNGPAGQGVKAPPQHVLVGDFVISVRKQDGSWRHFQPVARGFFDDPERRFLLIFLLSGLVALPLVWLFADRLARPIARLADSAERIGQDPASPPPEIAGPAEVERAARAVQGMQKRLSAFIEDRTAMLGAIAHDLRTPLTRLAFRAEKIAGPEGKAIRRDLADMNAMVESTLAYVRGAHQAMGERRPVELGALVEQVAADLAMTGRPVSADIEESAVVLADPVSLGRVITNLMENGAIHGGGAHARLEQAGERIRVVIDDSGNATEGEDLERLFEPFVRGDPARSRGAGGSGLGLSVARSLARAHGGEVTLAYRPEGGIRAILELPLA